MLQPRVGRHVHYFDHEGQFGDNGGQGQCPLAAVICHVHSDCCVNLAVFDCRGDSAPMENVLLVGLGEERPERGNFAAWPEIEGEPIDAGFNPDDAPHDAPQSPLTDA